MFLHKIVFSAFLLPSLVFSAYIDDTTNMANVLNSQNEIMESNYSHDQLEYSHGQKNTGLAVDQRPTTWLQTARETLSGPAGEFMVHMAKEMISRSTGNSQVGFSMMKQDHRELVFRIKKFKFSHLLSDSEFKSYESSHFGIAEGVNICGWINRRW